MNSKIPNQIPTQTRVENPKSEQSAAVRTAYRLLNAKQIRDARNKALCVCLQYIGDNGPCPVHGDGQERQGNDQ
jgi:hypothetical protein